MKILFMYTCIMGLRSKVQISFRCKQQTQNIRIKTRIQFTSYQALNYLV